LARGRNLIGDGRVVGEVRTLPATGETTGDVPPGRGSTKWINQGFTLVEVVIASVILAIAVAAFASVLVYQANLRNRIAVRGQAYELMEENLKNWANDASYYHNPSVFYQNPTTPYTLSEPPQTINNTTYTETNTIELVPGSGLAENEVSYFSVNLGSQSLNYYLVQVTSVVKWDGGAKSISGTTLVAPDLLRQASP
jgi:prepilin-type N-terminal cleavage/methylation domain-containing protein